MLVRGAFVDARPVLALSPLWGEGPMSADQATYRGSPEFDDVRAATKAWLDSRWPLARFVCQWCGYRPIGRGRPSINTCPQCRGDYPWTEEEA